MTTSPPDAPPGSPGFSFSPEDAMAFMQKMWNPFGMPIPGFTPPGASGAASGMAGLPFPNAAAMFATLDPAEVERKLGELRVVEGWLQMTLSMMQMSIKTMELQKASLEALRGSHAPAAPKPAGKRGKS